MTITITLASHRSINQSIESFSHKKVLQLGKLFFSTTTATTATTEKQGDKQSTMAKRQRSEEEFDTGTVTYKTRAKSRKVDQADTVMALCFELERTSVDDDERDYDADIEDSNDDSPIPFLPLEIRRKIWRSALSEPRIQILTQTGWMPNETSAMFEIREAREEAASLGLDWAQAYDTRLTHKHWVNFEKDIFWLQKRPPSENPMFYAEPSFWFPRFDVEKPLPQLARLAICIHDWIHPKDRKMQPCDEFGQSQHIHTSGSVHWLIKYQVKELYLVCDAVTEKDTDPNLESMYTFMDPDKADFNLGSLGETASHMMNKLRMYKEKRAIAREKGATFRNELRKISC